MYQKPGCEAGEGLSGAWVVPVDLCEAAPEQRIKVSVRRVGVQERSEVPSEKGSPNPESCLWQGSQ